MKPRTVATVVLVAGLAGAAASTGYLGFTNTLPTRPTTVTRVSDLERELASHKQAQGDALRARAAREDETLHSNLDIAYATAQQRIEQEITKIQSSSEYQQQKSAYEAQVETYRTRHKKTRKGLLAMAFLFSASAISWAYGRKEDRRPTLEES